ncbi:cell wall anchor protein, partial [Bacillus mycoides]
MHMKEKRYKNMKTKQTIAASTLALAMIAGSTPTHAEVNDATPQQSTGDRLAEIKQHKQEL